VKGHTRQVYHIIRGARGGGYGVVKGKGEKGESEDAFRKVSERHFDRKSQAGSEETTFDGGRKLVQKNGVTQRRVDNRARVGDRSASRSSRGK